MGDTYGEDIANLTVTVVSRNRLPYVLVTPDPLLADVRYPLVILLHGYRSDMYDLAPLAIETKHYIFAFPNAPYLARNGGYGWTERSPSAGDRRHDFREIKADLLDLTDEIIGTTGADPSRVAIGGFSQGGGLALALGLSQPCRFAGIIVMSSALRLAGPLEPSESRRLLPLSKCCPQRIFLSHGRYDPLISVEDSRKARSLLERAGNRPTYKEYDAGHEVPEDLLYDLLAWLLDLFIPPPIK